MKLKYIAMLASLLFVFSTIHIPMAKAAPVTPTPLASPSKQFVVKVGSRRGFYKRYGHVYYNGYRGHPHYRHGYRHYRGHYFPRVAFTIHIDITPRRHTRPRYVVRRPYPHAKVINVGALHVRWCHAKYRSYRASDNTFQPYHGHRKRCHSPYAR